MVVFKNTRSYMRKKIDKHLLTEVRASHHVKINSKGPPSLKPITTSLTMYVHCPLKSSACNIITDLSHSARRNQQQSRLLHMPPEIRNMIYDFAMDTSDHCLHIDKIAWDRLNLSRTCHQIYAETVARYHVKKIVPLMSMEHPVCPKHMKLHIVSFLAPAQLKAIWQVQLRWSKALEPLGEVCMLKELTGLRSVVLYGGPKRMTRKVWVQTKGFREWLGKKDLEVLVQ